MLTADRAVQEVEDYTRRVEDLYVTVRSWASARFPGATFTYGTVEKDEESTGVYAVRSMTVHLPGRPPLVLKPVALFNLGARGQVEVSGWWAMKPLFWVTGDQANEPGNEPDEEEMLISRPAYPNVPRGWVWLDPWNNRAVPLTAAGFWDEVAGEARHRITHGQPA